MPRQHWKWKRNRVKWKRNRGKWEGGMLEACNAQAVLGVEKEPGGVGRWGA